jgi:hypothetical protein
MVRAKLWELPSRRKERKVADRTVTGEIAEVSTRNVYIPYIPSTRIDIEQSERSGDGKDEVKCPLTLVSGSYSALF